MSPNLWVSLQVAHMCIKLATDMRFDNSRVSQRRKRSSTHLDTGLAINAVNTHAQLLGNMLSTICELEVAHGQTQTKKKNKTADQQMQPNAEEPNGRTVQTDRRSAPSRGPQNRQRSETHTTPPGNFSNTHDTVKDNFKHEHSC